MHNIIGIYWPVTYFIFFSPKLFREIGFLHSDWLIQEDSRGIFLHGFSYPHSELGLSSLVLCNLLCLLNLHFSSMVSKTWHFSLITNQILLMLQCLSCQLLPLNTIIPHWPWFFLGFTWTPSVALWSWIFWDNLVYSFIW